MTAWTAKNPLGIIALFISLIYGMSALLLGATIGTLSEMNQTILVWFVVIFPVAVLIAFLWLVARHHRKLYSPADFRSDEGFLTEPADPQSLGARLALEVDEISNEVEASAQGGGDSTGKPVISSPSPTDGRAAAVTSVYVAESLAFRQLEREFPGQVRQHVRINAGDGKTIQVDGVIETGDLNYIVEVKFFTNKTDYRRRIREAIVQITNAYIFHEGFLPHRTKAILIVIIDDDVDGGVIAGCVEHARGDATIDVSYRIYKASDLLSQYGFTTQ